MFFVHTTLENFESATITGYFGFVFEKDSGREITCISKCFRQASYSKCFPSTLNTNPPFSYSSGLWSVFEKLRFLDSLVWTVGQSVEIKLRFRDGLVWTVGQTVEIKLRFRDRLVWTVGQTVEINLRFRDG